jgi:hypothetical protein
VQSTVPSQTELDTSNAEVLKAAQVRNCPPASQ